ncbi:hypothetical protein JOF53_007346 [Crossiella equi]|uniref:Uncharacterized protein n=1 Tax=Crossiella equi TaxID=130796 RepID=A0ABS5API0_9PSEU|nr:hypothetical protein [Crossiella equi]MBP2478474.1 hypothetical protein [Crossiella equi]
MGEWTPEDYRALGWQVRAGAEGMVLCLDQRLSALVVPLPQAAEPLRVLDASGAHAPVLRLPAGTHGPAALAFLVDPDGTLVDLSGLHPYLRAVSWPGELCLPMSNTPDGLCWLRPPRAGQPWLATAASVVSAVRASLRSPASPHRGPG